MPLHLLGKKSWNVYNPESIARVKRDEAAADALNEQHEREENANTAADRLKFLRGEEVPELSSIRAPGNDLRHATSSTKNASYKKRRLPGEDDTDRDLRLAKVEADASKSRHRDVAIFDSEGHFSLMPEHQQQSRNQNPTQAKDETVGMRFKDAAGYRSDNKPWYNIAAQNDSHNHQLGKDVWGNEDPRRHQRDQVRLDANDPLLAMKRGVRQLREHETQRSDWLEQREKDLYEVERLARAHKKSKRDRQSVDEKDSLDGFSLDSPALVENGLAESSKNRVHDRVHRKHRPRRRSRSRSKSPDRKHRHHHYYRHRSKLDN